MVHWCRHLSSSRRSSHQSRLHETFANWKTFCGSLLLYTENTEKMVKNLLSCISFKFKNWSWNEPGLSSTLLLVLSNVNKLFADVSLLWGVLDDSPLDQGLCLSSHPQQWSLTASIDRPEKSKSKSPVLVHWEIRPNHPTPDSCRVRVGVKYKSQVSAGVGCRK